MDDNVSLLLLFGFVLDMRFIWMNLMNSHSLSLL